MEIKNLIPYTESIPAPAQILILFEQFFFMIHIVLVNSIIGLSLIIIYKNLSATGETLEIKKLIAQKIPILFAIAINMAIPALLFIQVVFGHFFYTSSVLLGTFWILIIPSLIVAYYASYFYYRKVEASTLANLSLLIVIFIMLYIAFILVNNLTLMEEPQKWSQYFEKRDGTILLWKEITIYPRYFHFIVASLAVGGIFYAVYNKLTKSTDKKIQSMKIKEGLKIFSYATVVQMFIGILFLLTLPKKVMLQFMGGDFLATLVFISGIVFATAAMISGFKEKLNFTLVFLTLTILAMIINRYNLRIFQLGDYFKISELKINPQWDVFVIFLLILFAGVGVIIYMLKLAFFKEAKK
ncbi:hypothetical protein [Thermodesulfovibrio sp.]|uniref:hypothetical protein n=1 Tax=Thermodesulfovibrio sp. TaxID=2067987 RepID=UPI003D0FFB43